MRFEIVDCTRPALSRCAPLRLYARAQPLNASLLHSRDQRSLRTSPHTSEQPPAKANKRRHSSTNEEPKRSLNPASATCCAPSGRTPLKQKSARSSRAYLAMVRLLFFEPCLHEGDFVLNRLGVDSRFQYLYERAQ